MDIEDIKKALEQPGKSKSGLAKALGIPNSAVTALLKGQRLLKLRELPKVKEYFASDSEPEFGASETDRPTTGILEIDVRAGMGGGGTVDGSEVVYNGDYADPVKSEAWHFPSRFVREELRAPESRIQILETQGDSMAPTILSGDRVIIDTGHRRPTPDGIYAIRDRYGFIVVKRLQALRRGEQATIRIISDNKAHDSEDVAEDEIHIVGRVIWGLKRL
jgi:phage repressor protein C with HTH and peptisase S24 domain